MFVSRSLLCGFSHFQHVLLVSGEKIAADGVEAANQELATESVVNVLMAVDQDTNLHLSALTVHILMLAYLY